jgi:hypothetical protein
MQISMRQNPDGRAKIAVVLTQEETTLWRQDRAYVERLALYTVLDRQKEDVTLAVLVSLGRSISLYGDCAEALALVPMPKDGRR